MTKRKILLTSGVVVLILILTAVALIWNGVILLNNPSKKKYPVRGVDVSSYQGEINWNTLSSNDISFAFIKATEGSTYVDPCFEYNYTQAQKTSLRIGAYHFFSYDSSGLSQADNFINTVPKTDNMLPPVIDVEFYGDKKKNPPSREEVSAQLKKMTEKITEYYSMTPIIYATEKSYSLFISDEYPQCDIWIRDVIFSPKLSDKREWTFWQYTNRERLEGYNGKEKYIDMNVFYGSKDTFDSYAKE